MEAPGLRRASKPDVAGSSYVFPSVLVASAPEV